MNKTSSTTTTTRSYSSVVGNNSNETNTVVVKAPINNKESNQSDNKDQNIEEEIEIDPFILERLEDDNDRMFILRLEYEMTNLIKNKKYLNMISFLFFLKKKKLMYIIKLINIKTSSLFIYYTL